MQQLLIASCAVFAAACDPEPTAPKDNTPACPAVIPSADHVIDELGYRYRERDYEGFVNLLADDAASGAVYEFIPAAEAPEPAWDRGLEVQVHRRMFAPDAPHPGEPDVPLEFRLTATSISLTQVTPWEERPEFYRSEANPTGLSPEKWKVTDARFSTFVFFDTRTDNDFLVEGESIFAVIEELDGMKDECGFPRFLLLRWQDIRPEVQITGVEQVTWTAVKNLYRVPNGAANVTVSFTVSAQIESSAKAGRFALPWRHNTAMAAPTYGRASWIEVEIEP